MGRLSKFRSKIARWVAPKGATRTRMYTAARSSRLTDGWSTMNSSSDAELVTSLQVMRSRSRALMRDASYARRARTVVVNNVIGSGIGMQAQVKTSRADLATRVNQDIEALWADWSEAESCHTGGRLAFEDFERAAMAQVFDAGEVFIRKHHRTFGDSPVPFALELIEAERIADNLGTSYFDIANGNELRMGIEVDPFFRPVAYFLRKRHPLEIRWAGVTDFVERVPADQIIHLCIIDRWPQTRGEPWLHTAIRRMNDMDGYSEAEITRARVQACNVGAIETPEESASFGETQSDGTVEMEVEPGVFKKLSPGEKLMALAPTAPNPAMDPFMRYMLREVAAGTGVSYESLSRDYSQSNYSSSRLALLEDRDLWRVFQQWFLRSMRCPIHEEWLQTAVLAGALKSVALEEFAANPDKFYAVRFKPRGWSWIDPTSEVNAYKEAIKAGLTTVSDVVAATADGRDLEDVLEQREQELAMMKEKGLEFDTSPGVYVPAETRGNMVMGDDGMVEPAAVAPPAKPPASANPNQSTNAPPNAGRSVLGVVK